MNDLSHVRDFSIIAHIDHGKSTLADRFIQMCGDLSDREMKAQVLDFMDLEHERGITIKVHSVTLYYKARDGKAYQLNFIDTLGHVDFTYEINRSLAAREGAPLVVDAGQGVEAQSVVNCYAATKQGLEVMPVLNKIGLPRAGPERMKEEIESIIGIGAADAVACSAKSGMGVLGMLEHLVTAIPAPEGEIEAPLQALIIDSWFDNYLGVVSLIWVKNGRIKKGDKILVKSTGKVHQVDSVGVFTPKHTETVDLKVGGVGFIIAGIKDIHGASVGDALTLSSTPDVEILPGFKRVKSQVYVGLFPVSSGDFKDFRDTLQELTLNDSSLQYEPGSSEALGFGFRRGFLDMLHMEVIQEHLEREYNLDLITTASMVVFKIVQKNGEVIYVDNPSKLPDLASIQEVREPICCVAILVPKDHLGNVIILCIEKRGVQHDIHFFSGQVQLVYNLPVNEAVFDFFDCLKSTSRGYVSLDHSFDHFKPSNLVRFDVPINSEKVDALALIVHRDNAPYKSCQLVKKMKELIPRWMFNVAIQAAIDGQIIARLTVKALRRNVLVECYGGDMNRKRKLLEKQKIGKKKMKQVGSVEVPQEAFLAVLKADS